MNYTTISYTLDGPLARVTFTRPEVHNAFNDVMLREILDAFGKIAKNDDVRAVVITGEGKSFCAGADLNWMKRVVDYSYEENLNESLELAECMYRMYACPKPTIARVNGAAIGGGTGFVAVCDFAVAAETAKFSFSEVKIGVVPACISPYVITKIGEGKCREFFLTGERLKADRVLEAGLVNRVVPLKALDEAVDDCVKMLLSSGPDALKMCKQLIEKVSEMSLDSAKRYTAEVIASLRMSPEGQEGMAAFLEKRKPNWVKE
jgi:methylglutaconyl-CoA hydratase